MLDRERWERWEAAWAKASVELEVALVQAWVPAYRHRHIRSKKR